MSQFRQRCLTWSCLFPLALTSFSEPIRLISDQVEPYDSIEISKWFQTTRDAAIVRQESLETVHPSSRPGVSLYTEATPHLPLALRGVSTWYLRCPTTALEITIRAKQHNTEQTPFLYWELYDDLEQKVDAREFASSWTTQFRELKATLQLPSPGLYRLQIQANRSVLYDVETNAETEGLGDSFELDAAGNPLNLYFQPKPGLFRVEVKSFHFTGLQTIGLYNAAGRQVASVYIQEPGTPYTLAYTIPENLPLNESFWRINIPIQDVLLNSPNVDVWIVNQPDAAPLEPLLQLISPKSVSRTVLRGATTSFLVRVKNADRMKRDFIVEVHPPTNLNPGSEVIHLPNSFQYSASLPGGVSTNIFIPIPTLKSAPADATAELIAVVRSSQDTGSNAIPLARSRLVVTATSAVPIDLHRPALLFDTNSIQQRMSDAPAQERAELEAIRNQLIANAESILSSPMLIHEMEGELPKTYVCDGIGDGNNNPHDGDGSPLVFEADRPYEHICPVDGRIYRGSPYDEAWIELYHELNARIVRNLGRGYAVTGDERYAIRAIEMMNRYAELYVSFPLRDEWGGQSDSASRVTGFLLTEVMWALNFLEGLSAVWSSPALTDEVRINIEYNLLRPIAENILRWDVLNSNIQAWLTGIEGLIGLLINDRSTIEHALRGPRGLDYLLSEGLLPDGVWFEGSPTYHYFGLRPISIFAFAAERLGEASWDSRLDLAYFGPMRLLLPNNRFPRFNDSGRGTLASVSDIYELAAGRSSDPRYDAILSRLYEYEKIGRTNPWALLVGGPRELASPLALTTENLPELGTVALRNTLDKTAFNSAMFMDYGPQGASHGHDDKLNVMLYSQEIELLPDFGLSSSERGNLSNWFARTLGHNTILTGERDQEMPALLQNPLKYFRSAAEGPGPLQIARAEAQPNVYSDGAQVSRTMLSSGDEYWLIVDDVTNAQPPIDVAWHLSGFLKLEDPARFIESPAPLSWTNISWGYQLLIPPRRLDSLTGALPKPALLPMASGNASPIRVRSEHRVQISDSCDDLLPWQGSLLLSETRTEGEAALRWTVIPRLFSSIFKNLTHPSTDLSQIREIQFDVRLDGAAPSVFGLLLQDPGRLDGWYWDATGRLVSGEWRTITVDVTQPDAIFGSSDRSQRIVFYQQGPTQGAGASFLTIDRIQARTTEGPEQPVLAGTALTTDAAVPRTLILADGPGEGYKRDIPVLLARTASTQTRVVTLVEPYENAPRWSMTACDGQTVRLQNGMIEDEWRVGKDRWAWLREERSTGRQAIRLELVANQSFVSEQVAVAAVNAIDLYLVSIQDDSSWEITYSTSLPDTRFRLEFRIPEGSVHPEIFQFILDDSVRLPQNIENDAWILEELPGGEHRIRVYPGYPTSVQDWLLVH